MKEQPKEKGSQSKYSQSELLTIELGGDGSVLDTMEDHGIAKIQFKKEEKGMAVTIIGYPMIESEESPILRTMIEIIEDIDKMYEDFRTRFFNLFSRPLDVKELGSSNAIDLSIMRGTVGEKALHAATERYKGPSELSYINYLATYSRISDRPTAYTTQEERSSEFDMWKKQWESIREELIGKEIIAFWWDEKKLHIIWEVDEESSHQDHSDGLLQEIVVAQNIYNRLKLHRLEKRVTMTSTYDDCELGERLHETEDDYEWSSSFENDSLELTTDMNGLIEDEDELDALISRLGDELSVMEDHENIIILLTKRSYEEEEEEDAEEWRQSLKPDNQQSLITWDIELHKKIPNGNV